MPNSLLANNNATPSTSKADASLVARNVSGHNEYVLRYLDDANRNRISLTGYTQPPISSLARLA